LQAIDRQMTKGEKRKLTKGSLVICTNDKKYNCQILYFNVGGLTSDDWAFVQEPEENVFLIYLEPVANTHTDIYTDTFARVICPNGKIGEIEFDLISIP